MGRGYEGVRGYRDTDTGCEGGRGQETGDGDGRGRVRKTREQQPPVLQ